MTVKNAIKKITTNYPDVKIIQNKNIYETIIDNHLLSFIDNGGSGEITCIHIQKKIDKSDPMADYFPGSFFDNISQAIRYIKGV